MSKVTTYSELKSRKKPSTRKVLIALDDERADAFNELAYEYRAAEQAYESDRSDSALKADYNKKKKEYEKAAADASDFTVEFTFRSIGRKPFEDLVLEHPATKEQIESAKKNGDDEPGWNPDTFMPALMAAAIVSPNISEEEMTEMWESEDWNLAELMSMFLAALAVNQTRKVVDLGKDSGQMLDFGLS